MNNQQIFDKVCERLRDGTGRASGWLGGCYYLSPHNGLKCSVGIFIKDGHEAQNFDGDVFRLLDDYSAKEIFGFELEKEESIKLLSELQSIHDNEYNWKGEVFENEGAFRHIAQKYNLKYTPPN